ncbi:MAG TPA: hypothetical protein VFY28_01780 [Candidatus Paceibacterota bacterium]|nr:hypothetical protein [Candidatus Paceibacterota bacterium]
MSSRFFIPPGISAKEWEELTPLARVLVESGMYLHAEELLPRQLYVEHLLSKVDPKDYRDPRTPHEGSDLPRMQLKLFLQFLENCSSGAYARRVLAVAEACGMRLCIIEDGASLYTDRLSPEDREEFYRS